MNRKFQSVQEAALELGVCAGTIRNWANNGEIYTIYTRGGHRRVDITSYKPERVEKTRSQNFNQTKANIEKKTSGAIYARVSSKKQSDDLERQIKTLKDKYPDHEIFKDICSGINYKRKGLKRLLEQCKSGNIKEVVVAHKDRLARFGVEFIDAVFGLFGVTLIVLNDSTSSPNQELTEDLMAIIHVFSCRLNGKRRYSSVQSSSSSKSKKSKKIRSRVVPSERDALSKNTNSVEPNAECVDAPLV